MLHGFRLAFPRPVSLSVTLLALALAVGCRDRNPDPDGSVPDGGPNPMDGGPLADGGPGLDGGPAPDGSATDAGPGDTTVYAIQGGEVPVGTRVDVRGVIVTAIDGFGARRGNFWVQEPGGGPLSGVLVFGASAAEVEMLQVGDVVDVENAVTTEFALGSDTSGRTTTQLERPMGEPLRVRRIRAGTPPEPATVDALAIGRLPTEAERDAAWEQWEGVLIRVQSVARLSALRTIGDDPTHVELRVTGPLRVDSSLAAIDTDTIGAPNNCFASITGVGDYFFNYKILPRSTGELVSGGAACPAPEDDAAQCTDGIDNDANGFADCADRACQSLAACSEAPTIARIRMGDVAPGTRVVVSGVHVIAVDDLGTNRGFWVADDVVAAPWGGIYVFTGASVPAGVAIGALVDLGGTVAEFRDVLTQIDARSSMGGSVTLTDPSGELPLPLEGVAASTLASTDAGEPYESTLVRVGPARVRESLSGDRLVLATATGTIVMDDDALDYASADYPAGTCFATVTGVMGFNSFDEERRLFPRLAADLVTAEAPVCAGLE